MKKFCLLAVLLTAFTSVQAQRVSKLEQIFGLKQKWTSISVKSRRPYFEIGEVLTMRIDRKFYHDRNNYAKLGGEWILTGNTLILAYDNFTEERKRTPFKYTIKKWGSDGFTISYRNRYDKGEKVYFK